MSLAHCTRQRQRAVRTSQCTDKTTEPRSKPICACSEGSTCWVTRSTPATSNTTYDLHHEVLLVRAKLSKTSGPLRMRGKARAMSCQ
ncbi:uncharacterized protein B0H18DRAFT_1015703, partial [Fomitopsis serialis]|uniref:uncharacterized protein n=1 Tax=Fomitopsis serialis TaxID=139415 RepID=UPI0020081CCB